MELEKEIKQKKFSSERAKAHLNILFTGNWLNNLNNKFFKEYGLSSQQYNVLRILRGKHPEKIMLGDIQCRMLDRMSNASRLVDKLVLSGLVMRQESEGDRRKVDIWITQHGLDLLARIDRNFETVEKSFGNISEEEAAELNKILDKLRG